ncbi:hypothetical protein F66182_5053 [Fusarium sp. NRRL 66182]|nr:hypothetical protein F66182_5053 [Fusarium sp. NRRL 66182]
MIIIAGNVLLFTMIAIFFLSATNSSFIDNAWHTVAQISQSHEAQPLLERATLAADSDIEGWLHGRESNQGLVGNVKAFFKDIGRVLDQRRVQEWEKLSVRNGVFTEVGSR